MNDTVNVNIVCAKSPPWELKVFYQFYGLCRRKWRSKQIFDVPVCISLWMTSMVKYMLALLKPARWSCIKASLWLHHSRWHDQRLKRTVHVQPKGKPGSWRDKMTFLSQTCTKKLLNCLIPLNLWGKNFLERTLVTVDLAPSTSVAELNFKNAVVVKHIS